MDRTVRQGDTVIYHHPGDKTGVFPPKTSPAIVLYVHNPDVVDLYVLTSPTYDAKGEFIQPGGTYTNIKCTYGDHPFGWTWTK